MPALTASPATIVPPPAVAHAGPAGASPRCAAALAPGDVGRARRIVHTFLAKDGTTVVSGYDGGAVAPKSTP